LLTRFAISVPILRLRGQLFRNLDTGRSVIATQQLVKNIGWLGGSTGIATPIRAGRQALLGLHIRRDNYLFYIGFVRRNARRIAVTALGPSLEVRLWPVCDPLRAKMQR